MIVDDVPCLIVVGWNEYRAGRNACAHAAIGGMQPFGSSGGVFVDFFGQKAATATGPVVFAMRTKAPIVPMFVVRQKDDTHKIIIEPPLKLEEPADDKTMIQRNTEKITQVIERYIRKYPQEWGWMHRRWKSQPKPMPTTSQGAASAGDLV